MKEQKPTIFVTTISQELIPRLKEDLIQQGFELMVPPHTHFSAKKKGVSCTLYLSGKLTVQGKEMAAFIEFYLEPEILHSLAFTNPGLGENLDLTPRIGVDESGKGDFFGPLCIAAVFAEGAQIQKLRQLGVRDSKTVSDAQVKKMAAEIKKHFQHHIVRIGPSKYNELYKRFRNLNRLLAWGHATVIEKVSQLSHCTKAVVDQFAHEHVVEQALAAKKIEIELEQKHRAEEDPVVAAASILARAAFLEGIYLIEKETGLTIPLGASDAVVKTGKKIVSQFGTEYLMNISKQHFRTFKQVLA